MKWDLRISQLPARVPRLPQLEALHFREDTRFVLHLGHLHSSEHRASRVTLPTGSNQHSVRPQESSDLSGHRRDL